MFDAEEADKADDGEVGACGGLLESTRVDKSLGVNVGVEYEKEVVSVGEIDKVEADCCETEDKWCDDGVGDGCDESVENFGYA